MSLVLELGANQTKNVKIEKPIASLVALITASDIATVERDDIVDAIIGASKDLELSAIYRSKGGDVIHMFSAVNLLDLMELSQFDEGVITLENNGDLTTITGIIPVGEYGMISFDNDETLELKFTNGGTSTLKVHTLQDNKFSPHFPILNSLSVAEGTKQKEFGIGDVSEIIIPASQIHANTVLSLTATNGVTVQHTKEVLKAIMSSNNDCTYSTPIGMIQEGKNMVLDVSQYATLRIDRSTTSALSFLAKSVSVVNNLQMVKSKNQEIFDTTIPAIESEVKNQL